MARIIDVMVLPRQNLGSGAARKKFRYNPRVSNGVERVPIRLLKTLLSKEQVKVRHAATGTTRAGI
jgi:hypothetical protein